MSTPSKQQRAEVVKAWIELERARRKYAERIRELFHDGEGISVPWGRGRMRGTVDSVDVEGNGDLFMRRNSSGELSRCSAMIVVDGFDVVTYNDADGWGYRP